MIICDKKWGWKVSNPSSWSKGMKTLSINIAHTTLTVVTNNQLLPCLFNAIKKSNSFPWMLIIASWRNFICWGNGFFNQLLNDDVIHVVKHQIKLFITLIRFQFTLNCLVCLFALSGQLDLLSPSVPYSNILYLSICWHANHYWDSCCLDSCFHQFLHSLDSWVSQICVHSDGIYDMFPWTGHWILQSKLPHCNPSLPLELSLSNHEFKSSLRASSVNLSSPVRTRQVSKLSNTTSYSSQRLFRAWIMNSI